jgi:hypothetical protein
VLSSLIEVIITHIISFAIRTFEVIMFGRQDAANEGPGPNREGHVAMELLPTQDRYNVHLHQNGGK